MNNETLLVIFVGMTGFALLVQAIVMVVAAVMASKAIKSVRGEIQEVKASVLPIINKSRETLDKVAPRIESVASDVSHIAETVRHEAAHIRIVTDEILDRVHNQSARVDGMVTSMIDGVEHASTVVADSVARPARQVSAVLASAKAFLTVLATGRRNGRPVRIPSDQDMFV